jgi:hypothetical protein
MAWAAIDRKSVACAAKYLSMTSWYGHDEELEQIAASLHTFERDATGLHRESWSIDFDLPSFSSKVRFGIANVSVLQSTQSHEDAATSARIPEFLLKRRDDSVSHGA